MATKIPSGDKRRQTDVTKDEVVLNGITITTMPVSCLTQIY